MWGGKSVKEDATKRVSKIEQVRTYRSLQILVI